MRNIKIITIKHNIKGIIAALFPLLMITVSCKKLVEIPPPQSTIAEDNVFTNNSTAIASLSGFYVDMSKSMKGFSGNSSITIFAGLTSDEFALSGVTNASSSAYVDYFRNSLSVANNSGSQLWNPLYNFIFRTNAALKGLNATNALTASVKQQLVGEAKFLRAYFYFYLLNLFGDVPLALTSDYKENALLARTSTSQVYQQIVADLTEAENLLSNEFLNENLAPYSIIKERTRPTKWAASALLSRTYLYMNEFAKAEASANMIINNGSLFSLAPILNNVFLKNSTEAIWQIQPTTTNFNTEDARVFIIPQAGVSASFPIYLNKQLLKSFEVGDKRVILGNWIDTTIYKISSTKNDTAYYSFKYKINTSNTTVTSLAKLTEYLMMLRLGEQYLIRAEARAQQGNLEGAKADLNTIRTRAGLSNTTAFDKSSLLAAILHERQVELFAELGHRWLDLKRTGNVDATMSVITPLKINGAQWKSYQQLYPLPQTDLDLAPNLIQNLGY